jgi:hypothetical protein
MFACYREDHDKKFSSKLQANASDCGSRPQRMFANLLAIAEEVKIRSFAALHGLTAATGPDR